MFFDNLRNGVVREMEYWSGGVEGGHPSSLRDELVLGRIFQAHRAWLMSVVASRLSTARTER
jgi:hypothetical protein